jgi:hypothetical protein
LIVRLLGQDLSETGLSLAQTALEIQGITAVILQSRMLAASRHGFFVELLGPVEIPQVFIALDKNVQKFQVARLPEISLLQILYRQFNSSGPLQISGVLHQTG